jgi:hypothetical protein
MRPTLENLLIIVSMMHTANQMTIFEIIQKVNDLLNFFMKKQAIPHLVAWSSIINNESSNHRDSPGWALTFK